MCAGDCISVFQKNIWLYESYIMQNTDKETDESILLFIRFFDSLFTESSLVGGIFCIHMSVEQFMPEAYIAPVRQVLPPV